MFGSILQLCMRKYKRIRIIITFAKSEFVLGREDNERCKI